MNKKTIGFLNATKVGEKRIAFLPKDVKRYVSHPQQLYFEQGYGQHMHIDDEEYLACGCHIEAREDILKKDILCDPKIGDMDYIDGCSETQALFGWIHEEKNASRINALKHRHVKMYAWESMNNNNRHCFYENNVLAGEAAVLHAFLTCGSTPYKKKVALIGRGNVAQGALRILHELGAEVIVYSRLQEKLFRSESFQYDVLVNAVLWDTSRKDHILYESDLLKMKNNTLIVDISCDPHGAIETSKVTTIAHPMYSLHGVQHYVLDHTPTLLYDDASRSISKVIGPFVEALIENKHNKILSNSLI